MTEEKTEKTAAGQPEDAENRIYEIGYLIVPTVSEEELPREVTALKDILEKEKVSMISEDFPKLRVLAYEIKKRIGGEYRTFANAYFGWVKFEGTGAGIRRIEENFRHSDKILRFILIKTVREQTLVGNRPPRAERAPRKEAPKDAPASAPVSETELDKSIEKLIAE